MAKAKEIELKITSAIVLGGEIVRPGTVVTVTETQARNLLHRGKAELATDADKAPAKKGKAATAKAPADEKPATDTDTAPAE